MIELTETLSMPATNQGSSDNPTLRCLEHGSETASDAQNLPALKERLRRMWMAGDYGHFAQYLAPSVSEFFEHLHIQPGTRVLDLACGAGQLSVMAARLGAIVTGLDLAPNSIEQARARASAENLDIDFVEGDVESLPYSDASFDLVVSLIGAMFAPRPTLVASEMLRVCRPGGRIAMGNWTPSGFVGRMFEIHSRYVTPPPEVPPPVLWGSEIVVRERLGADVGDLRMTPGLYRLRYPFPPADVVEFYRICYGPTNHTFAALDPQGQAELRRDLEQLWSTYNLAEDGKTDVEAAYLAISAVRL
jgi:SAM-dependent methyltransferase